MLSASTGCFMTHDYEYVKGMLEQTSAEGIEVIVYRTYMLDLATVGDVFYDCDLPVTSVHSCKSIQTIISTPGQECIAQGLLCSTVDLACRLDSPVVVAHAWDGRCYSLDIGAIQECIAQCADYAHEHGVSLSIEAVPSRAFYPPDLVGRLLSAAPNASVTLDFEYASMYDMYSDLLEYCSRISNVHLRDYKGQWIIDGKRMYVKPGDGAVDFKEKIGMLKSKGYRGTYTVEAPHCSVSDLERTLSFFRDII